MDDVLVHVLSPNVYRTPSEALQAFHWFSKVSLTEKGKKKKGVMKPCYLIFIECNPLCETLSLSQSALSKMEKFCNENSILQAPMYLSVCHQLSYSFPTT